MPLGSEGRLEGQVLLETPERSADLSRREANHWREILVKGAETRGCIAAPRDELDNRHLGEHDYFEDLESPPYR